MALTIDALEIALLIAFILGVAKSWIYRSVLVFHGISTLTAYKHYAAPFEGPKLLYSRFSSRGESECASKLLSARRFEFGGHNEKSTSK